MEEMIIETYSGKRTKVRTYNILDESDIQVVIDHYIYPYLTEEAKNNWDKRINYKREEHQIRP